MSNELNAGVNDLELEYQDAVSPSVTSTDTISREIEGRFKGKSAEDLVSMHVNLEKVLRRQGNELGQLRKVVDAQSQLLNQRPIGNAPQAEVKKQEPITAEKLLNDPQAAVNAAIEQAPAVSNSQQRLNQLERSVAQNKFEQANPTYMQDVNDPEFQAWVVASGVRSKLLLNLHNYDFNSGNELWELWKEHREAKTATETARQARIQQASVVKPGSVEAKDFSKPLYSRAKLAELQMKALNGDAAAQARWNDPEFQREYMLAYAEDRIK